MTPDEIQKDRETGTPGELAERLIRIKDGITHRADRDALSNAVNLLYALTTENAALKARVAKLEAALKPFARRADAYDPVEDDDWMVDWYDSGDRPTLGSFRRARAALEKSHD